MSIPDEREPHDIYALMKRLFGEYTFARDMDTNEIENSTPQEFIAWLQDALRLWIDGNNPPFDLDAVCKEVGGPPDLPERFIAVLSEYPEALLEPLHHRWMAFSLGCRPAPQHPVAAIQYITMIRWRDGRVCPMTAYVPEELCESILDDAGAAFMTQEQIMGIFSTIRTKGLDGLYEEDSVDPNDPNLVDHVKRQIPGEPNFTDSLTQLILQKREENGIISQCPPHGMPVPAPKERVAFKQIEGGFDDGRPNSPQPDS